MPARSQQGSWYGGVGIGQSNFKGSCDGVSGPGISCSETDTAGKIFGGYQLNRNFAFEVGYTDLGQTTASVTGSGSLSIGATGVEFTGIGMLPLDWRFSLFAKLGFFSWKLDFKDRTGLFGSSSASGTNPTFGFGAKYDFTRNTAVRGEWQRYKDVGDPNSNAGQGDIDFLGVSVLVRF
jgi:OOP family OmpA-OmpF porin